MSNYTPSPWQVQDPSVLLSMRAEYEKEKIVDEMIDEIIREEQSGV